MAKQKIEVSEADGTPAVLELLADDVRNISAAVTKMLNGPFTTDALVGLIYLSQQCPVSQRTSQNEIKWILGCIKNLSAHVLKKPAP